MNRILQFTIFFTIFIAIYFALNYYVLYRITTFFDLPRKGTFYALTAVATLSYLLTTVLSKNLPGMISKALHCISSIWMGVMFFLFTALILYEIVRPLLAYLKVSPMTAGITILSIVAIVSICALMNALFIDIKEVEVPMTGLKDEMTVVQLSDVHVGSIRNSGFLQEIAEKVNKIGPDAVFITGDLVDGTAPLRDDMFHGLDKIKAPIFMVTGNHETYEGLDEVMKIISKTKIRLLRNEVTKLNGVQIIGVDFSEDKQKLKETLDSLKINKTRPSILLYHSPIGTEYANEAGINLQLAGHTHNGQIFPFNFLVRIEFKHIMGLYKLDGTRLYVSPGTGTWGPPMRLGSRNEITKFRLVPS
ncbi:MAG: metallophosphoesterase [Candidatus Woesearchaeota archaeon]